tara:strand:+ start:1439 stop:1951 length:513 start_codon:yes stop_codon:yes gene_type:complete
MAIKNRIKELRQVNPNDIKVNPKNWRLHSPFQKEVMKGVLDEIGIANALIVYEKNDELILVDGHLRQDTLQSQDKVPVLILDVTEAEADKLLMTLDPISELAHKDDTKLLELIENSNIENESINELLSIITQREGTEIIGNEEINTDDFTEYDDNIEIKNTCPKCNFEWS